MIGFGRSKNCKFHGTYFHGWFFIESFTEFIFAMDRFERLQREIIEKINDIKDIFFNLN